MTLLRAYKSLAMLQVRWNRGFLALALLLTVAAGLGAQHIYLETDFSKFLPQDNPAIVLSNRVRDTFLGQDTVFILVRAEPGSTSENAVRDIRDPRVMLMLDYLAEELKSDGSVDSVQGAHLLFEDGIPHTLEAVKEELGRDKGSARKI